MVGNGEFKGSLLGISIGTVTHSGTVVTSTEKMWRTMQALGAIAFAYSYSIVLIEIQVLSLVTWLKMQQGCYISVCLILILSSRSAGYNKMSSCRT